MCYNMCMSVDYIFQNISLSSDSQIPLTKSYFNLQFILYKWNILRNGMAQNWENESNADMKSVEDENWEMDPAL